MEVTTSSCHATGSPLSLTCLGHRTASCLHLKHLSDTEQKSLSTVFKYLSWKKSSKLYKAKVGSVHSEWPFQESNNDTLSSRLVLFNVLLTTPSYGSYLQTSFSFSTSLHFVCSTSLRRYRIICLLLTFT